MQNPKNIFTVQPYTIYWEATGERRPGLFSSTLKNIFPTVQFKLNSKDKRLSRIFSFHFWFCWLTASPTDKIILSWVSSACDSVARCHAAPRRTVSLAHNPQIAMLVLPDQTGHINILSQLIWVNKFSCGLDGIYLLGWYKIPIHKYQWFEESKNRNIVEVFGERDQITRMHYFHTAITSCCPFPTVRRITRRLLTVALLPPTPMSYHLKS